MTKLEEMKERIEVIIRTTFNDIGTVEKPTWFMEDADGGKSMGFTPFYGDEQKDMVAEAVKTLIKNNDICRYIFVVESWLTILSKDGIQESERERVVLMIGEDRDTLEEFTYILSIDKTSKKPTLKKKELPPYSSSEGSFSNMFGHTRTVH